MVAGFRPLPPEVEREARESGRDRPMRGDVLLSLERLEQGRADGVYEVDLALSKREHLRLLVLEHAEEDLVDLGSAVPVALVRLEPIELVLLPLHELEGAGSDRRDVLE